MDLENGEEDGQRPGQRLRRRRTILLGVVIVALIAAVGGLLVSTTIKSPADLAAQTRPPGLTQLTTTVHRQVISSTVLAQGKVSQPPEVSGPAASGGGVGSSGAQPIVTRIFLHPGTDVAPGSPILEVAGRPVFVFAGTVPAYRNLAPGESGEDVTELQLGLESLGFGLGADTSGVYGRGTAAAVAAFYQSIGYPAPMVSAGPKASRGAMMPLSEYMFVPRFPARVASLGAKVGGTASGKLVTLSLGNPGIAGQLNPNDRGLVRPGVKVTITDTVTGRSFRGRVTSVRARTKTKGSISGGIYLPMRIRPRRPLPASLIGQNLTLTITAAHSSGPVLAVPEAAVFASASGSTYVTKVTGSHAQIRVQVRTGITGDGLVQVTPVGGGTLAAGDAVLTGENYVQQGPGAGLRQGRRQRTSFKVVPPG